MCDANPHLFMFYNSTINLIFTFSFFIQKIIHKVTNIKNTVKILKSNLNTILLRGCVMMTNNHAVF